MFASTFAGVAHPVSGPFVLDGVGPAEFQRYVVVDDEAHGVAGWEAVVDRMAAEVAWRLTSCNDGPVPVPDVTRPALGDHLRAIASSSPTMPNSISNWP